jgi:cytochrome c biogenesis protein ResB
VRYPLPFTIELVKATRLDHPRTTMAKAFSSDVIVADDQGRRPVKIEMNAPLRYKGYVLFQSQMNPVPTEAGTVLTSGLSTVRNPSDHWPTWSCIVIAIGLLIHFLMKLSRYTRSERARYA